MLKSNAVNILLLSLVGTRNTFSEFVNRVDT